MLTVYVAVAMLLVVVCSGAPLSRLAAVRIRHAWLLWAALIDQIVITEVLPDAPTTALAVAHVASYLAAGACLLLNRGLPGAWLIGAGGALNGVVISVNGGTLPASASAVAAAGPPGAGPGAFSNSAVLADPHLSVLGDIFATPSWLPGHNVFSIGDAAIWLGLAWLLWRTCRRPRPAPRHLRTSRTPHGPRHSAPGPAILVRHRRDSDGGVPRFVRESAMSRAV